MSIFDEDYKEEELDEIIRQTVKISIRTLEIMIEEIEKSSLPQVIKENVLSVKIDLFKNQN